MEKRTLWLRRARRVHFVCLFTCHIWSLDQKVIVFLKLLRGQAHTTVTTCYSNSPPNNPKTHAPSPAYAATKPFAVRTKKGRGRRRGEERGSRHAAVRRHCSPPKTGRIYSPLSIFPHLHGFSSLFVVVPPCVLQFGAIEGLP